MTRTTPEQRAELARLNDGWSAIPPTVSGFAFACAASAEIPDLLADLAEAEAERDSLTEGVRAYGRTIDRWGKLIIEATGSEDITTPDGDGDWEVVEHRLSEVRAEQERLTAALRLAQARATDAETEARLLKDEVKVWRDLAGRCLADNRQSVCMLPVGHASAHDDCMGCTWTDADHWEPSVVDRVADEVARIADESQHEGWDSPRVRSIVGRIRRAIDGGPTDER